MFEQFPRDAREFGAGIFLAAMISLAGTGYPCLKYFPAWRNAAQNLSDGQGLVAWLDEVDQRFAGTLNESVRALATRGICWEKKITAALHLATLTATAPSQLLGAHAILFDDIVLSSWKRDIEHGFSALVTHGWRRAAQNRWSFQYPQQVPAVLAKCDQENAGLVSASRLLSVAMRSVEIPVSSELRATIQQYAS